MFNTPVLFLIFNRPDTTKQVFEKIRQIKPTKLYVAADAARENLPGEIKLCEETRSIIDQLDWPCELKTLYREKNLGCKIAVSEAITWFFSQEEYGIILEDDCLPDLTFFNFCEELLIKYKNDDRIGHIGGNNFLPGFINSQLSYDFCSFSHIWGWATWRRVWKNFNINFPFWEEFKNDKKRQFIFNNYREKIYFSSFISDSLNGKNNINAWDTQYLFTLRTQSQLSIYPSMNLVSNIGLNDKEATHTKTKNSKKLYFPTSSILFPLQHPKYIISNIKLDKAIVRNNFFSYKRTIRYLLKDY